METEAATRSELLDWGKTNLEQILGSEVRDTKKSKKQECENHTVVSDLIKTSIK